MKYIFSIVTVFLVGGCTTQSYPQNEAASSNVLYYGFLPGSDYEIFDSHKKIDFKNKSIRLEIADSRNDIEKVSCAPFKIDRKTEVEGKVGMTLVDRYFAKSFQDANAKIDFASLEIVKVEVEALSYRLEGFGQITAHGIVQLKVKTKSFEKKYCVDLTDKDGDSYSPLSWYSFDTRIGASRKMVSAALRKAVDQILGDL